MLRGISVVVGLVSLGTCLLIPVLYFWGSVTEDAYKQVLTVASLGWFVAATIWATRKPR